MSGLVPLDEFKPPKRKKRRKWSRRRPNIFVIILDKPEKLVRRAIDALGARPKRRKR